MEKNVDNKTQKMWKKVLGILLLIFMTPIGVIFMWCTKIFSKKARIVVSCICAPLIFIHLLVFIVAIFAPSTPTNTQKDTSIQTNNEEKNNNTNNEENKDTSKEEKEVTEKTELKEEDKNKEQDTNIEKNESKQKSEDKTVSKAEEVSFNDLKRNPDNYVGKKIIVKGYINQVLEGNDDMPTNLKIYDDTTGLELILLYDRKEGQSRYLEGDYISSVAIFDGIQGLDMLDGSNQAFPIAVVETIKANEDIQNVQ